MTALAIHGSCKTCKFFDSPPGSNDGICRCHAPQVSVIMIIKPHPITQQPMQQHQVVANFAPVGAACWCGEYQANFALNS